MCWDYCDVDFYCDHDLETGRFQEVGIELEGFGPPYRVGPSNATKDWLPDRHEDRERGLYKLVAVKVSGAGA